MTFKIVMPYVKMLISHYLVRNKLGGNLYYFQIFSFLESDSKSVDIMYKVV